MCSHFNIEDERRYATFFVYYALYFKKVNTSETQHKKICAVYEEAAVTDSRCQKWFVNFLGTIDILAK